jgi:hypothetical protein
MNLHRRKVLWIALGSLLGLLVVGVVAGIIVAQSQWFRAFVRAKIISTVEDSTGGKVEIASFGFDWRHLRADLDNSPCMERNRRDRSRFCVCNI